MEILEESPDVRVKPPTKPGFYRYTGGAQNMVFLLDYHEKWHVWFDNGTMSECVWAYIEQCLGVWALVRIDEDSEG